ncbi:MAG: alpha/beta fold hydrolase [Haloarculaceae archaeon]
MTTRGPRTVPDQPSHSDERVVSLDDRRQLAYAEYGSPDGAPVLFLHGTPGSRRLGALVDAPARERDVRVLALDRPGYGRSTPWPDRTVTDAPDFVAPVLDDAGVERAGLVAFSGGCPYALATAAANPDRVGRVDVVAGAVPPSVREAAPLSPRLVETLATAAPPLLGGAFRVQAWLAGRDPSLVAAQYTADGSDPVPEATAALLAADFREAVARHRRGVVTEFRDAATDWGVSLDAIDADVCLWHGADDANVPIEDARRLASRLPTARFETLPDADHLRALLRSAPEVLARHRAR